ncbi:neuroligin-4, Y-linked-like [Saccostrea cucullata]|uniref:neuroligin-4, Y-linked-like n=1 Tax=Saccostrea cuccullata TaxID=36930 RepID=UPI002ED4ED71
MAGIIPDCFYWMLFVGVVCSLKVPEKSSIKETEYGKVQGVVTEPLPRRKVANFLGIPYAKPPIGNLRFVRTQRPDPWGAVKYAGELPPACPQTPDMSYVNLHSPGFNREDEDCLYINVYVPQRVSQNIPVFLYVHGGSNRVGMGAMLRGDILAAFGDIIVVNFNYRLGSLGFYAARKEGLTGNYGFFDQVMALHWVKDNIAKFGGDPEMVTIAGHSAGAADVGFHVISPLSKGLFRRAMIMSGSPIAFWGLAAPHWKPGYNIAEHCDRDLCPRNRDPKEFKNYLMQLPWKKFTNRNITPIPTDYQQVLTFPVSIVDEEFITERPETAIQAKKMNCESFVFSITRDEGSVDVMYVHDNVKGKTGKFDQETFRQVLDWYKPIYPKVPNLDDLIMHEYGGWENFTNRNEEVNILERYTQMESDIVFVAPMVKLADLLTSAGVNDITFFSFEYISANNKLRDWEGIPHGADLFYIFGLPHVGHPQFTFDDRDREASTMTMTMWTNFVKTGVFSVGSKPFQKYSPSRSYNRLHVSNGSLVVSAEDTYHPRRMEFWNSLLPSLSTSARSSSSGQHLAPTLALTSISFFIFHTWSVFL